MPIIRSMRVLDVRFPTSRQLDGSDAMNPDPDYSAAYVVLETDHDEARRSRHVHHRARQRNLLRGDRRDASPRRRPRPRLDPRRHGPLLAARDVGQPAALDRPRQGRDPPGDGRGRQRGVGSGRKPNASRGGSWPTWLEELVRAIDFRYLTDCLTPDEALDLLPAGAAGRTDRAARARRLPVLHDVGRLARLQRRQAAAVCREAVDAGFGVREAEGRREPWHDDIRP